MKFLTFVDLHDDKKYLKDLVARASKQDIDFVVCAGDFSQFGAGIKEVLAKFNALGKKIYLIPGNHEEDGLFEKVIKQFPNCVSFHKDSFEESGYVFLGYGGDGFSMEDKDFRKKAREWYGKYKGKKIVLVTHGPPFATKLDKLGDRHVGNKDYRNFILRIKPKLVICGHIHENVNVVDEVSGVKIINPGWEGMVVELG